MNSNSNSFLKPNGHRFRFFRTAFPSAAAALLVLMGLSGCSKSAPPASTDTVPKPANVAEVRAKAEKGDALAQTALGKILVEGRDTRPDYVEAVRWFRQAADQGAAEAQFYLASLYEAGRGVARDDAEAVRWNRKAAEAGFGEAQYALALLYARGQGTPKDKPASVKWFRAAADQGLPEAQFNLAQRYQHGQGVATNLAEAFKWFSVAAKQGVADAVKESKQLKAGLSAEQISEGERFAASFVPKPSTPSP